MKKKDMKDNDMTVAEMDRYAIVTIAILLTVALILAWLATS